MNQEVVTFPQYRKMNDRNVWYKITSKTSFEEIQELGKRSKKFSVHAEQYPEKLRILDMLSCHQPFVELEESAYKAIEARLQ